MSRAAHISKEMAVAPVRVRSKETSDTSEPVDFAQVGQTGQTADVIDIVSGETLPPYVLACENLARAMWRASGRKLPKQERLEQHFDRKLGEFRAVWSAEIAVLLDRVGAEAATLGDRVALRSEDVSYETLLHEAAHLLQTVHGAGNAEAGAEAAEQGAREVTGARDADVLAFRAPQSDEQTDSEASAEFRGEAARQNVEETETQDTATPEASVEQSAGPDDPLPMPEVEGDPLPAVETTVPDLTEEAAAAKAAFDASVAAIGAAETPEAFMAAFQGAPPSLKAEREPTLSADMAALGNSEADTYQEALPERTATMRGDEADVPEVSDVAAPEAQEVTLEEGTPEPAPEPAIAETQEVTPFVANEFLGRIFGSTQDNPSARDVAGALGRVSTTDGEVETTPGPAPNVPLEGENDPQRATDQASAAADEAAGLRDAAMGEVIAGPGPEQVEMRTEEVAATMEFEAAQRELQPVEVATGTAEFQARELDPETTALFDAAHDSAMQESLSGAQTEMDGMVAERDSRRETSAADAETQIAQAEQDATTEQATQVGAARQGIQDERQAALDDQDAAVQDMNAEAETENATTQAQIADRVATDEAQIADDFAAAETEAEGELADAEARAEAERNKAEDDAESDSWWDAAADWVGEQLSKLGDLIGDIFAALRDGITFILDKAKDAAFALIDAAAGFIKDAIALYGEFLKLAVTNLIGSVFPELAEQINNAIDEGVRMAQEAVDAAAEGLKTAVNAAIELYKSALLAILDFVEGALNTVLAVAAAAIAGDWAEVARLILEPVLGLLGIDPQEFYAYVGETMASFGKIIDDPLAFLSNMLDAVVGGFQLFADNFMNHIISGIVNWLTGALGGVITMPERFDFWGVLDLARQILGLTVEMIRRVAVRILGEAAVERIEFFMDYAIELITGGWGAFFDKIKNDLSGLVDMVLGGISSFLMERVVKAGVLWLASLINPAGALVKLVMMIWDFISWLLDNLQRFMAIVRTVVDGIVNIANGVIEPASQAIERVLAMLIAPAIDLIARLLGLGNVGDKVQEIIGGIHKRIEDAIVKLIRAVLARFTGRSRRGAAPDGAPDASGDLMQPMRFSGGGETHTLYVAENGNDVVPMMRSTPTAVKTWVDALKNDAGVKAQLIKSEPDVTDEAVTAKKIEIAPLVARALGEEQQMDAEGEETQDDVARDPENSADDKAELARAAEEMATALTAILNALGLSGAGEDFAEAHKTGIGTTGTDVQAMLNGTINRRVNENPAKRLIYSELEWAAVVRDLPSDEGVLTGAWVRPFHSTGVFRGTKSEPSDLLKAIYELARQLVRDSAGDGQHLDPAMFLSTTDAQDAFLRGHLLAKIGTSAVRIKMLRRALGPASVGASVWAGDLSSEIQAAIDAANRPVEDNKPDADYKANVKAASFRANGMFAEGTFVSKQFLYYSSQETDGSPTPGVTGVPRRIDWFLKRDGDGSAAKGSDRWQKNITYTADMIRAASPGQHEWILSSMANQAIEASISQLDSDGLAPAVGFANFVEFQHEVRTPTSDLIFDPVYVLGINPKSERYVSADHFAAVSSGNMDGVDISTFYKSDGPQFGDELPTLQAHAGGLYSQHLNEAGTEIVERPALGSSPRWHEALRTKVSNALTSDGALTKTHMSNLGDAIREHFVATILDTGADASSLKSGGVGHGEYRLSGAAQAGFRNRVHSLDDMIAEAVRRHDRAWNDLDQKIKDVVAK